MNNPYPNLQHLFFYINKTRAFYKLDTFSVEEKTNLSSFTIFSDWENKPEPDASVVVLYATAMFQGCFGRFWAVFHEW